MKYFAYGSNMDPEEMKRASPDSEFVSIAKLNNYRLDFTRYSKRRGGGVADIVPEQDSEVWGVVYEVSEGDLEALDHKEGVAPGAYERRFVEVCTPDGERLPTMTYSVVKKEGPVTPTENYYNLLLQGARYWGLPKTHIEHLSQYVKELVKSTE